MDSTLHILLVDDDPFILEVLRIQLERILPDHVLVERALGPMEALDILKDWKLQNREELSLIISDYLMPEMLGSDFLIEANQLFPKSKKMMLTGQADTENVLKVLHHMSLFRFMGKPWDPTMMNNSVLEAIREFEYYYQLERNATSSAD